MELMDAHCHLDDAQFDADRENVYARMLENGVVGGVDCGSDIESSQKAIWIAENYQGFYAAAGFHPHEAERMTADDLCTLKKLLAHPRVKALGEIGLDYYYDGDYKETQKRVLRDQLQLALEMDMPVVYHIRDAHGDMVEMLRAMPKRPGGVVHCFSGSAETALEYVRMGYYISFAGPLTFKKAPQLERACCAVPEDRLLVETDSPYMAPVPNRGKRNEPANVRYVLEKMAVLRGKTPEEMARITLSNTKRVYRL